MSTEILNAENQLDPATIIIAVIEVLGSFASMVSYFKTGERCMYTLCQVENKKK